MNSSHGIKKFKVPQEQAVLNYLERIQCVIGANTALESQQAEMGGVVGGRQREVDDTDPGQQQS